MTIFVVVGMPASGKNIARTYADSRGIPYFATGDVVRGEVAKRGLAADAENTAIVSTELRGTDGMGVTRLALSSVLKMNEALVFMEGMRSWPEIELIRAASMCVVIAFLAPRPMRLERIISRGRQDDSVHAFDDRDMREIAYGTAVPIALADEYILNTATMDEALADMDTIVRRYTPVESTANT
jgi:dephospho-CoA kinase